MGKQKRSINTYQKINTIFKRDDQNVIMPYDSLVSDELEYLRGCKFDCEEKIDGTNIRIEVTLTPEHDSVSYVGVQCSVEYKGKTDSANVPKKLMEHLVATYPEDKVLAALGLQKTMTVNDDVTLEKGWVIETEGGGKMLDIAKIPHMYTLYGEGYGAGIQKGGGNYTKDNLFIGFDVKVDDVYLLRPNRDDIFNKLGCPIVPFIGQFTIDEAIEYAKNGFQSKIAETSDFLAEGLVCRTPMGLKNKRNERIIFKVKTCDWNKYYAVYHTYDQVEQVEHNS